LRRGVGERSIGQGEVGFPIGILTPSPALPLKGKGVGSAARRASGAGCLIPLSLRRGAGERSIGQGEVGFPIGILTPSPTLPLKGKGVRLAVRWASGAGCSIPLSFRRGAGERSIGQGEVQSIPKYPELPDYLSDSLIFSRSLSVSADLRR
jgi:hypothetical protein